MTIPLLAEEGNMSERNIETGNASKFH